MQYEPPQSALPGTPPPPPTSQAVSSIRLPAIFLIITFGMATLYALFSVIGAITGYTDQMMVSMFRELADAVQEAELADAFRQAADQMEAQGGARGALTYFFPVLGLLISGLGLYGSIQMLKLRSYGLAMTAAIIAVIPCFGPCCCLGIPFGIWALVVMNQPNVKLAFRR